MPGPALRRELLSTEVQLGSSRDAGSHTDRPYSYYHQRLRGEDCEAQGDHLPVGVDAAKLRGGVSRAFARGAGY